MILYQDKRFGMNKNLNFMLYCKRFIGYFVDLMMNVCNQTMNDNSNNIVDYEINYAFTIHCYSNEKGCILENHIRISC